MPQVSILLTCYNHIDYLPQAVQSIREQSFTDFEVIALDDGSTDGTREWLTENLSDQRLEFNEKNLGTYGTLNRGLDLARGEYIAVFNDDDVWLPTKLEKQVAVFEAKSRVGLVHTSGWFIDDNGERHPDPEPLGFPWPKTGTGDMLGTLIHHNQIITSSVLVRRQVFAEQGPFDPSFYGCGDWQRWLLLARFWEIAHIDEDLTLYRVHGTNAARNNAKMDEDSWRIREWITTWEDQEKGRCDGMFAHNWACLGTENALRGDMKRARRAYLEAIKRNPIRPATYARYLTTLVAPARARQWR